MTNGDHDHHESGEGEQWWPPVLRATLRNPNVELEGHSHDLFDTSNCFRHILEKDYQTGLILKNLF